MYYHMPRHKLGDAKRRVIAIRLSPAVHDEARRLTPNLSRTVEGLLTGWIKREQRKARPDTLARPLAPPAACEIAAQRKV